MAQQSRAPAHFMFGQNPCSILVCLLSLSPPTHPNLIRHAGAIRWKFILKKGEPVSFTYLTSSHGYLFMQLCDCNVSLHAPPNSRTWGAVCDKYARAYAQTDNNQLLPSSLPNRAQMHYHLLLLVTKNGKAVDKFNIVSCLKSGFYKWGMWF